MYFYLQQTTDDSGQQPCQGHERYSMCRNEVSIPIALHGERCENGIIMIEKSVKTVNLMESCKIVLETN